MIGNYRVCDTCGLEVSTMGLVSDGTIEFIGNRCLEDYIRGSEAEYNLVDLELALRMQADSSFTNLYLSDMVHTDAYLRVLVSQSIKVDELKYQLNDDKQKLLAKIEEIFNDHFTFLDQTQNKIDTNITHLKNYKLRLCSEGRNLAGKYHFEGSEAFLPTGLERIDTQVDHLADYIQNNIYIYYSNESLLKERLPAESCIFRVGRCVSLDYNVNILRKDKLLESCQAALTDANNQIDCLFETIENQEKEIQELRLNLKEMEAYLYQTQKSKLKLRSYFREGKNIEDRLSNISKELIENQISIKLALDQFTNDIKVPETKVDSLSTIRDYHSNIQEIIQRLNEDIQQLRNTNVNLQALVDSSFGISFLSKKYIYVPNNYTRSLTQYDILSEKAKIIDIPTLPRDLSNTSICELPNGAILIAGFSDPESSEVYLYEVDSKHCSQLPSMNYKTHSTTLFYYNCYVYAFGGEGSGLAERYLLDNNRWEILPYAGYSSYFSCVGIYEKIYLFYGKSNYIKVFNTETLMFEDYDLNNSDTNHSICVVSYRVDERIYLVTDNLTQVYDTNLIKLEEYNNTYKKNHYAINSIQQYGHIIYYYNYSTSCVEKIDTTLPAILPQAHSEISRKYIYKLRAYSRLIHKLDLEHSTLESINLFPLLNRNFNSTSICLLDSGEVFLAGFSNPVSGECYLYSPSNNNLTRLPDLNTPRYNTTLIYHNYHVYAFGGRDSSTNRIRGAEKLDILSLISWTRLNDMRYECDRLSCVCIDNKIYIMGAQDGFMEIYDIRTDCYQLNKIYLESSPIVSLVIDEKIHIIGGKYYKVFDRDLRILVDLQERWESDYTTYTMGNVVYYKDKVYFFNDGSGILEEVDTATFKRKIQVINHMVNPS